MVAIPARPVMVEVSDRCLISPNVVAPTVAVVWPRTDRAAHHVRSRLMNADQPLQGADMVLITAGSAYSASNGMDGRVLIVGGSQTSSRTQEPTASMSHR